MDNARFDREMRDGLWEMGVSWDHLQESWKGVASMKVNEEVKEWYFVNSDV